MDRERLALGFGETIESLRNEVESMWDDIQISFDKIDREIDETISRYKPTGYYDNKNVFDIDNNNLTAFDIDTTQILYESDNPTDNNINDTNIKRYNDSANKYRLKPIKMAAINSMASSISSASGASPNIDDDNNNYYNNYNNMQQKPKSIYTEHRISAYSTPIHTHIMNKYNASYSPTSPNYNINKRILKNYNSNHSDISDMYTDDIHDNINEITFDKRLSKTHELLSDLNDFNRNDTVHNAPPVVPGLDPNQKSFRIELSNPNDSPKGTNQREINHIDDIDIDIDIKNNIDIGIDDIDSDHSIHNIDDNDSDSQIIVDRMQLINRISIDLETNAHIFQHRNSHHERNNTMHKNIFNDGNNISDEDELDLTKIKREDDQNSDENSGHSSLAYLFKDNESDSDTQSDTDSERDLIVLSNRINSKQRLSIPKGLSNIDVTELANHSSHSANDNSNDEDTYIQIEEETEEQKDNNNNNNNNTEQDDKYPLALPMIPQTSSVDHKLDAAQTPQDVSNRHEKKKSISQLALQDLELDRKVNINNHHKHREYNHEHKNVKNVKMNSVSYKDAPLTPLAMMTQIGIAEMNDIPDISDISNINSKSVPSPPGINGYNILNATKITPTAVKSDDYINIFNSDRNGSGVFKFDGNGSDNNNNITDINYENNHNLQSGINRADSNYENVINKGIDIILKETSLYEKEENKRRNSKKVMVSPEVKNKNKKLDNNVSYSFDDMNNSKTPIINEENIGEYNIDLDLNNIIFDDIEETLLIIKKNGEEYINNICDRLANEDLFYINEFIEIDKQSEAFYKLNMFLNKYNKNIHNINNDVKSVILLFNELLLNNSIVIIPLYRVHGIHFLYECIIKYQSLKLLNDEVSSNEKQINENNENNNIIHLKKPTDELPDIDNSHFHDYNEYPSDDNDDNIQKIDDDHINDGNLRELFSIHNVYAPKNKNEYNIIKNVLCPNTKYYNYNIYNIIGNNNNINKYKCMECIGIIKPNAVINGYESLIRATLIGNGFIIPKCKTIKYNKNEIINIYNHRLNMDGYKYYINNNINMNKIHEYLSSGCIIIMIIKKYIGLNRNDECLNINDCFNKLNELIGYVDPQIDRINDENTQSIRGCFGEDYIKNIIDITTTKKDYKNNVQLFFDIDQ